MSSEALDDATLPTPDGWDCVALDRLVDQERGISYGIVQPGPHDTSGVPVVRVNNLRAGGIITADVMRVGTAIEANYKRTRLLGGEILMSLVGTLGECAVVPDQLKGWNVARAVAVIPIQTGVDPRWVTICLRSAGVQQMMRAWANTTVQATLNLRDVRRLPILLAPEPDRSNITRAIAELDDKIEQNRRTGRKLEELARAVFKAWFVDFEPVKAKAAGATAFPGMPPETFAALPKTLKDSPLGPVPEGWEVAAIKDRTSAIQYGLTTSATAEAIGPQFLRITDIRGGSVDWGTVPYCVATAMDAQKYRLIDGDIVVARTGASTGENMYVIEPPDCVFASYLVRFRFADRGVARLVGAFMRTETYQSFVTGSIGGSAQPNANAQTLASSPLVFPPTNISGAYYDLVHPLDLKRAADARESAKLATLRDYLLPRLLSGKVRVGRAD